MQKCPWGCVPYHFNAFHLTNPTLYQLSYRLLNFHLKIAIHKGVKVDFLLISVTNTGGSTICR